MQFADLDRSHAKILLPDFPTPAPGLRDLRGGETTRLGLGSRLKDEDSWTLRVGGRGFALDRRGTVRARLTEPLPGLVTQRPERRAGVPTDLAEYWVVGSKATARHSPYLLDGDRRADRGFVDVG